MISQRLLESGRKLRRCQDYVCSWWLDICGIGSRKSKGSGGSSQPRVRLNLNRSGSRGNLLSTFKLSKNAIALGNTQDAAYVIDEAGVGIASQDHDIPDHVAPERGGRGHATVSKGKKNWRREGTDQECRSDDTIVSPAGQTGQERLIEKLWSE